MTITLWFRNNFWCDFGGSVNSGKAILNCGLIFQFRGILVQILVLDSSENVGDRFL